MCDFAGFQTLKFALQIRAQRFSFLALNVSRLDGALFGLCCEGATLKKEEENHAKQFIVQTVNDIKLQTFPANNTYSLIYHFVSKTNTVTCLFCFFCVSLKFVFFMRFSFF